MSFSCRYLAYKKGVKNLLAIDFFVVFPIT
jgi:hypothetical protein